MDYTTVFRQLIYKDREDIDEFPVDETDNTDFFTMESVFMEKLEARRFIKDSFNAPELILMIFNNARYITTLIYSENHPQHYLHKYLKIAENDSRDIIKCNHAMPATMALVVNYLLHYLGESFFGSKIVKAIIENFKDWDTKGASEGKQDFYDLLIDRTSETDKYPNWATDDGEFTRRDIKEVLSDADIDPYEIIADLDYVIQETFGMYAGDPECPIIMKAIKTLIENFERTEQIHETTREMLDIANQKLKKAYPHAGLKWKENVSTPLQSGFDVGGLDVSLQSSRMLNPLFDPEREDLLGQIDDLKDEVNHLAREKAALQSSLSSEKEKAVREKNERNGKIEQLQKERKEWWKNYAGGHNSEPEKAFNVQTGMPCFTSRQMGILLTAIGRITEKENPPGKTTLGIIIEKIAGYKSTTASSNMRGEMPSKDTETVATAIESKFPNLAAEVRKV
ncbi:hypothetical protein [Prevotella communis]|uniref:hypothetical protein n=1 Tax=Prevotella communis TaxID=2913614 RepID=UPI001EDA46DE|nr:hypothetical protein [Prevotella communis]UKK57820.1 hypothetical protein L6476_06150 [Prevotella communis]